MTSWRKALFLEPPVLALFLIIAIAATAAFWIDGEMGGEAEPVEPVLTRWGNVTFLAPPPHAGVVVRQLDHGGDLTIQLGSDDSSGVIVIDAMNGSIISDNISSSDRREFDTILGTLAVDQSVTPEDYWPYSNVLPSTEPLRYGRLEVPWPDPASGIIVSLEQGGGAFAHFENGRSELVIDAFSGITDASRTSIHPNDESAFSRLVDAIQVMPY